MSIECAIGMFQIETVIVMVPFKIGAVLTALKPTCHVEPCHECECEWGWGVCVGGRSEVEY